AGDATAPVVPLNKGWATSDEAATVAYGERVTFSPDAEQQLFYTLDGPVDLSGANLVFTLAVDQTYLDSGAHVQPFVQEAYGDWVGHWTCWIDSDALTTTGTQYECAIPDGFGAAEGEQIRVGIGAKTGANAIAGSVTITGLDVQLAVNILPLKQGWATSDEAIAVNYGSVSFSTTAEQQLY